MRAEKRWRVKPGQKVRLADWPTDATPGVRNREKAEAELAEMLVELRRLQYRLYAENRRAMEVQQRRCTRNQRRGLNSTLSLYISTPVLRYICLKSISCSLCVGTAMKRCAFATHQPSTDRRRWDAVHTPGVRQEWINDTVAVCWMLCMIKQSPPW